MVEAGGVVESSILPLSIAGLSRRHDVASAPEQRGTLAAPHAFARPHTFCLHTFVQRRAI
eukprot:38478-Chlamydomonas_euryale.AAC.3